MPSAEEMANGKARRERKKGTSAGGRLSHALGRDVSTQEMFWDDVDPRYVAWLVTVATRIGGAVTFGRSRDRGALMVTVLLDGDRETTWIAPRDDVTEKLQTLCEILGTLDE